MSGYFIIPYSSFNFVIINVAKVFFPSTAAFAVGIIIAPLLSHYLYKYKAWKKNAKEVALDGHGTPLFHKLHKEKETAAPKMGGVLIWASVFITIILFRLLSEFSPSDLAQKLDFLSRNQTWLPLFTLIVGSFIGLLDDLLEVTGRGGYFAGGLSLKKRLLFLLPAYNFFGYGLEGEIW